MLWALILHHKPAPRPKIWSRTCKAWKKRIHSLIPAFPSSKESALNFPCGGLSFLWPTILAFSLNRSAQLASAGMLLIRDIWDDSLADVKSLTKLSKLYGLQETKYEVMSDLADHLSESFAHLLMLPNSTRSPGEWLGAFEIENSARPALLFRTNPQYNPESLLNRRLLYQLPQLTPIFSLGLRSPNLILVPDPSQRAKIQSKKISISSVCIGTSAQEIFVYHGTMDKPISFDPSGLMALCFITL